MLREGWLTLNISAADRAMAPIPTRQTVLPLRVRPRELMLVRCSPLDIRASSSLTLRKRLSARVRVNSGRERSGSDLDCFTESAQSPATVSAFIPGRTITGMPSFCAVSRWIES